MSEIQGYSEPVPPIPDRRVHERRRVSLAYIDLGENNGGIVLNVSEGGLAVTAVEVLHSSHLPKMRFQLPHSKRRIEAKGQIAWTGESKKEAGVRFVDLPAAAAAEIRNWMASEFAGAAANGTVQQQYPSERDAGWRESYIAEDDLCSTAVAASEPAENSTETSDDDTTPATEVTHTSARRPFTAIMAPDMMAAEPAAPELRAPEMSVPEPYVQAMTTEEMRSHVPVVQLNAAVAAPATDRAAPKAAPVIPAPAVEAPPVARTLRGNDVVTGRSFAAALQKTKTSVDSAPPARSGLNMFDEPQIFRQALAQSERGRFEAPHRRWWALTALVSLFAVISFVAGMAAGGGGWEGVLRLLGGRPTLAGEPEKPSDAATNTAGEETTSDKPAATTPSAEETPVKPADVKSGGRNISSERTAAAPSGRTEEKENSSIVLSMPESSVSATSSVAITSRRSVQVTQESAPKSSLQGGSVQIGQLFYRVEPFYPPDAERQGIEGTVEVHAIVGRDGKVRAAEAVSGPPALSETAVKAVREWRYKPTTVNGQAIESEVNVKMIFRLPRDKNTPQ